jgi:hypothetical protein
MFQKKVLDKMKTNTYFMFNKFFSEKRSVREIMSNNRAGQATDNNKKRRVRFACWIKKATNAHSEYVILIAFPMTMMIWRRRLNVMFIACLIKVYFSLVY